MHCDFSQVSGDVDSSMFDKLAATLEKEMGGDILPRFAKSPAWDALVRLETEVEDAEKVALSPKKKSSFFQSMSKTKAPPTPSAMPALSDNRVIDRIALVRACACVSVRVCV